MIESEKEDLWERKEKSENRGRQTEGQAERGLYTADTWCVLITQPCDCPRGCVMVPCKSPFACECARLSVWVSSRRLAVPVC